MEGQMMSYRRYLATGLLWLAAVPLLAQTSGTQTPDNSSAAKQSTREAAHAVHELDGQHVFDQNCSRCHNAPQGFSPHISGTIIRHMRVRASLSKEEEQALLRFLNP
jgi:cytochrome c5